jgi:23S rRNA (uridine2552-2'-O)-methyltransferase
MTRWYREKKREHFYKEAKRVGYRARSAFKLQQIQQRFKVIPKSAVVVDLGAAPGGWSQIASELIGEEGMVIAADLSSIKPLSNVHCIQGDVTQPETITRLKRLMDTRKAEDRKSVV